MRDETRQTRVSRGTLSSFLMDWIVLSLFSSQNYPIERFGIERPRRGLRIVLGSHSKEEGRRFLRSARKGISYELASPT